MPGFVHNVVRRNLDVYNGMRTDATLTWFTITIALFVFSTFSVVGLAAGQIQEALTNYISVAIRQGVPWGTQASEIWGSFEWARATASFAATLVFASTLRYWTARLLGTDIDDYDKLQSLDQWKKDFILIPFLLPWLGAASAFFVAHLAALGRDLGHEISATQFIAGLEAHALEYLLFTPFLSLSVAALAAPIMIHLVWSSLRRLRQAVSKSSFLLFLCDLPLVLAFLGLSILFGFGGDAGVLWARALGPMVILNLSLAFLTAAGSWLIVIGRQIKLPVFWMAAGFPIALSLFGNDDGHPIRQLAATSPAPYSLAEALGRAESGAPGAPLVLVSAEGGGIRAAYFTAAILGRLEDQCPQLARRIFAISGVSGGAVGAAAYVAALQALPRQPASLGCKLDDEPAGNFERRLEQMFTLDHLSPGLGKQAFSELVQAWVPWPLGASDRQGGIEASFEQSFRRAFNQSTAFEQSAFLHQDDAPFLMLNATRVDNGALYIETPLDLHVRAPRELRGSDVLDFRYDIWRRTPAPDFRLSTMALNSARFPVISPAGSATISTGASASGRAALARFVDGGYFDNSGAESIEKLVRQIRAIDPNVEIMMLHIRPNPPSPPPRPGLFNLNLHDWELDTVLSTREARTQLSILRMSQLVQPCQYIQIDMRDDALTPFRLGWILSASAAESLREQVAETLQRRFADPVCEGAPQQNQHIPNQSPRRPNPHDDRLHADGAAQLRVPLRPQATNNRPSP